MAEFGVSATQLSGPQGAGSQPIAPVQEQAVTVDYMAPLAKIGDIFAKGLEHNAKAKAQLLKDGIVNGYVREIGAIEDGVLSGQLKPEAGAGRSRAAFMKYAAGNPGIIKELNEARNALSGGSELGNIEDTAKQGQALNKAREDSARQNGAILASWMEPATKEIQIRAAEANKAAKDLYEMNQKKAGDERARSAEQRTVDSHENKKNAITMLNTLAGGQMEAASASIQDIRGKVESGKMDAKTGELALQESFINIDRVLLQAANENPELASNFKSIFEGIKQTGLKALDPKNKLEDVKSELELMLTKGKLAMASDPKMFKVIVASQTLGQNATIGLAASPYLAEWLGAGITKNALKGEYVPQLIGNPVVEKDTLKFLTSSLSKYNAGTYKDQPKAEQENVTLINNVLKQTGDMLNDPNAARDPKKFVDLAKFYASPEYGQFASKGGVNPEAAKGAKYVWQSMYVPSVRKEVQTKLEENLHGWSNKSGDKVSVADAIDIQFSGSNIVFVPLESKKLDPAQTASRASDIKALKSSEAAVNQLIKIGAHLEGTTNYAEYWERNKYLFVPQIYPAAKGVIVNGYRSKGGRNTPDNWEKVDNK